jgi:flagellar assembly factor FliW
MPVLETSQFGSVAYQEDAPIFFPRGLPGFEDRHRFLALSLPHRQPLVFLQSLDDSALCFITAPVLAVDPAYRLEVSREDRTLVGLRPGWSPRIGNDVLCLAVISVRQEGPTANLLAPIVVNLRNLHAVQAVAPGGAYSHQQPLLPAAEVQTCS